MKQLSNVFVSFAKLFAFWILLFDFQRILFSIHNWEKFEGVSFGEWLLAFFYSIRLDASMAAYLCVIPLLVLCIRFVHPAKWNKALFYSFLMFEVVVVSMIHSGEINAYTEWNHKLTSRVFLHLSNPDEVMRTADYSMTFWFVVYLILEVAFAWRMYNWLYKKRWQTVASNWKMWVRACIAVPLFVVMTGFSFLIARGGWQPIPINIDAAYYSNHHVSNDLSVNSVFFFVNSYMLYNRTNIDDLMPKIEESRAIELVKELYAYDRHHENYVLNNKRPNVVVIVMESWSAEAIGSMSETKGATPNFDALVKEGLLFTKVYATGHTSHIGNASIFSGQPSLPEIAVSLQPEKHRKLHTINEDLKKWGYSSQYIFSGDLKYGNIGGFFMDHGFDDVSDENDFPDGIKRGKLNYYDQDLYKVLIQRINKTKQPFMHCAFTGSTHPPYDYPKNKNQNWKGVESDFMNSLIYADGCLPQFLESCKKQPWFKNTIFVFVADHGHGTPRYQQLHENGLYRIPFLIWGEPLKTEYRGKTIDKVGSQTDLVATLLYQMGGNYDDYPWSKDLLNPNAPEFAFHTVINGYGWITNEGQMVYDYFQKQFISNTFPKETEKQELEKCYAFLNRVYQAYKDL